MGKNRKLKVLAAISLIFYTVYSCTTKNKYETVKFDNPYKFHDEILKQTEESNKIGKHQYAAWEFSFQGDYKNALTQWDLAMDSEEKLISQQRIDFLQENYNAVDAREFLSNIVGDHQIVIINEAHHNSFHRHFTSSLLEIFYENGFRYFGLETLENGKKRDSMLNSRKYPIRASGFYSQDPNFGNMLRKALKMGFNVFPYENTTGAINDQREVEQAMNIKKIIDKYPDEKFLIHCGFGHVMEGEFPSGMKALAERLKEYTGIDPLTVSQVKHSEKGEFNIFLL
jgi:hypothetical protein